MLDINVLNSNQRIDKFLFRYLPIIPRSVIHKLIRTGQVRINSGRISSGYLLRAGDKLRLPPKHILDNLNSKFVDNKKDGLASDKASSRNINLEDAKKFLLEHSVANEDEIIIINKPAGLATQGGSSINFSLDDYLLDEYRLVHRIDKQTTGLLIIAKHYQAARKFTDLFKLGKIYKLYLALVYSKDINISGSIENDDGRSDYQVLDSHKNLHLIAVFPISGKKHQIRKHMQAIGATIIGDTKYNSSLIAIKNASMAKISNLQKNYKKIDKLNSYFEKLSNNPELLLHATCIAYLDSIPNEDNKDLDKYQQEEANKNDKVPSKIKLFYSCPNGYFKDFIKRNNLKLPTAKGLKSMICERISPTTKAR